MKVASICDIELFHVRILSSNLVTQRLLEGILWRELSSINTTFTLHVSRGFYMQMLLIGWEALINGCDDCLLKGATAGQLVSSSPASSSKHGYLGGGVT